MQTQKKALDRVFLVVSTRCFPDKLPASSSLVSQATPFLDGIRCHGVWRYSILQPTTDKLTTCSAILLPKNGLPAQLFLGNNLQVVA